MLFKSIIPLAICALSLRPFLAVASTDEPAKPADDKQFAVELNPETFDEAIEAGNVFVKFFAPW